MDPREIQTDLFYKYFEGKYILAFLEDFRKIPVDAQKAILSGAYRATLVDAINDYLTNHRNRITLDRQIQKIQKRAFDLYKQLPNWFVHPVSSKSVDAELLDLLEESFQAGNEESVETYLTELADDLEIPFYFSLGLTEFFG